MINDWGIWLPNYSSLLLRPSSSEKPKVRRQASCGLPYLAEGCIAGRRSSMWLIEIEVRVRGVSTDVRMYH